MLSLQFTPLTLTPILGRVRDVYISFKERFGDLNIPVLDIFKTVKLSPETEALLFEHFPIPCDHFGSSTAFYSAFSKLNYFMTVVNYCSSNKVEYSTISISFEDLLVINNFSIFKGL